MPVATQNKPEDLVDRTKSNQRIYAFLKACSTGVLATVDPNGDPHGSVVYYSVGHDFSITFTTKRLTKKSDNLKYNTRVVLVVYDQLSQTTAQITGVAKPIIDPEEAQRSFRDTLRTAERTSISGEPPISKINAGNYVAFKIKPLQIRMAVFVRSDPENYELFESVDFIA